MQSAYVIIFHYDLIRQTALGENKYAAKETGKGTGDQNSKFKQENEWWVMSQGGKEIVLTIFVIVFIWKYIITNIVFALY